MFFIGDTRFFSICTDNYKKPSIRFQRDYPDFKGEGIARWQQINSKYWPHFKLPQKNRTETKHNFFIAFKSWELRTKLVSDKKKKTQPYNFQSLDMILTILKYVYCIFFLSTCSKHNNSYCEWNMLNTNLHTIYTQHFETQLMICKHFFFLTILFIHNLWNW